MARAQWLLLNGRPTIQIVLTFALGGPKAVRTLLADTGAGVHAAFDFILDEDDCLLAGGRSVKAVILGGAYAGAYPRYSLPVEIPSLGFRSQILAVGIANPPTGFDGIACFRFLNRFTYGNFGDKGEFALET